MHPDRARRTAVSCAVFVTGLLLLGAHPARADGTCTYTLAPAVAEVPSVGGSGLAVVTAPTPCTWRLGSRPPWMSALGAGIGSGSFSYSVAANTTGALRTGTIEIIGETVTILFAVTQPGVPCTYSILPASASAPHGGAGGLVAVTAPAGCSWHGHSAVPWLSTFGSGSGDGSLSYTVAANLTAIPRTGTITIAGQTFTITQAAAPCSYTLTPPGAVVASGGESATAHVAAPAGCAWQAASQASWITVTNPGGGGGSGSFGYSVAPNAAGVPRSGSITVAGKTFTVTQAAAPCTYALSPTQAAILSGGGSGTVEVDAPAGCPWQATSQASWIVVAAPGSGSGDGSFGYSVAPNPDPAARNGVVAVADRTFAVTQAAASCTYSVNPTAVSVWGNAASGSVDVLAPAGCHWQATSSDSWITVSGEGSGNGTIVYSVRVNPDFAERHGSIALGALAVPVRQGPRILSIAPPAEVSSSILGVDGDRFTVNGRPQFLLFASYYDALRLARQRPSAFEADLAYLKRIGIDGIRIFPNWSHYKCGGPANADDDALFTRDRGVDASRWDTFVFVLQMAAKHHLLVDVTFTRETISDLPVSEYRAQIRDVTRQLKGKYLHVFFDIQNEHDLGPPFNPPKLTTNDVISIAAAIDAEDDRRIATVSTEGRKDRHAGEVARLANLEVAAPHPPRNPSNLWDTGIRGAIQEAKEGLSPLVRPVYLQEPMPFSKYKDPNVAEPCGNDTDADADRHRRAVTEAKEHGAAAYTFHSRTTFRMTHASYMEQLAMDDPAALKEEKKTLESLRVWLDGMPPGDVMPSSTGNFHLSYENDGNLVLYRHFDGRRLWESNTSSPAPGYVAFIDGNLALYDSGFKLYGETGTSGFHGAAALLASIDPELDQKNAWLEIRWGNSPIWRSDRLFGGQKLLPDRLLSAPNGSLRLTYRGDGNLVLTGLDGQQLWDSGTAGTSAGHVLLTTDGDLRIVDAGGLVVWSSGTGGHDGAYLDLDGFFSGKLAIRSPSGNALWVRP